MPRLHQPLWVFGSVLFLLVCREPRGSAFRTKRRHSSESELNRADIKHFSNGSHNLTSTDIKHFLNGSNNLLMSTDIEHFSNGSQNLTSLQSRGDDRNESSRVSCTCRFYQHCFPHFEKTASTGDTAGNDTTVEWQDVGTCQYSAPVMILFSLAIIFGTFTACVMLRWQVTPPHMRVFLRSTARASVST
eukprot:TRINITY_DN31552_c0_g1_i1.p1 TRINITY_DN31552_c0_g1~~TRINITY_DN31552_c0_g1_i1.p1  ORF type:complete len:189 (+),score=7.80 TRINITY_DN31552_c0_g1_i1:125-691(+)